MLSLKPNKAQRENLAKYCYDISKLSFVAFIVTNIMNGSKPEDVFNTKMAIFGVAATLSFLILGLLLNRKTNS